MGLFNFRTFAIMALCFAVFAFAAPAAVVEKRFDLSLNTAPITSALTQVSNSLSGALTAVDGVQKGTIGAVSTLAANLSIVGNAVGTLTLATAGALVQKTLALGSAAGNVATADANAIIGQVNTISGQVTTLANNLGSQAVTQAMAAQPVAAAIINGAVGGAVGTLGTVVNTVGGILNSASGTGATQGNAVLATAQSLITTLGKLKITLAATIST